MNKKLALIMLDIKSNIKDLCFINICSNPIKCAEFFTYYKHKSEMLCDKLMKIVMHKNRDLVISKINLIS